MKDKNPAPASACCGKRAIQGTDRKSGEQRWFCAGVGGDGCGEWCELKPSKSIHPQHLVSDLERGSIIPGRPDRIALAKYIRSLEAKLLIVVEALHTTMTLAEQNKDSLVTATSKRSPVSAPSPNPHGEPAINCEEKASMEVGSKKLPDMQ